MVNHGPTMGSLDGKSGKCPELWDGREVSAGVRFDAEAPRLNGLSTCRSRRVRNAGERANGHLEAPSREWTKAKCIREPNGYSSP